MDISKQTKHETQKQQSSADPILTDTRKQFHFLNNLPLGDGTADPRLS